MRTLATSIHKATLFNISVLDQKKSKILCERAEKKTCKKKKTLNIFLDDEKNKQNIAGKIFFISRNELYFSENRQQSNGRAEQKKKRELRYIMTLKQHNQDKIIIFYFGFLICP